MAGGRGATGGGNGVGKIICHLRFTICDFWPLACFVWKRENILMPLQEIRTADNQEFIDRSANVLAENITAAIADRGECILGLSGGSTPKPIYEALGKMPLDWDHVRCFLIDERYVPADHNDSNQKMIRESLVTHARMKERNLIFPDTALPLEECVERYTRDLIALFDEHLADIVVLGMGNDGHIASLFPPLKKLAGSKEQLAIHTTTDQFAVHDRITVSLSPIAGAGHAVFLLKGADKKRVWNEMIMDIADEQRWPAKRVLKSTEVAVIWG